MTAGVALAGFVITPGRIDKAAGAIAVLMKNPVSVAAFRLQVEPNVRAEDLFVAARVARVRVKDVDVCVSIEDADARQIFDGRFDDPVSEVPSSAPRYRLRWKASY